MNVGELKKWLADKKDDATVEVIAHNKAYEFTMTLGGGVDCGTWCDRSYDSVGFYVDELCQSEREQEAKSEILKGDCSIIGVAICPECGHAHAIGSLCNFD